MNVLVYVIYPGKRDEVMMLPVWRAFFRQLNLVCSLEIVDLSNRFPVGRNDVHLCFDLRRIRHFSSLRYEDSELNASLTEKLRVPLEPAVFNSFIAA
jgi:hypothetical protein